MKKLTFLRATIGAAAIVALGATASLAGDASNTHSVVVTVNESVRTIALNAVNGGGTCDASFALTGTTVRDSSYDPMTNALCAYNLGYVTDYSADKIQATASGTGVLGAADITLKVTAAAPSGTGTAKGTVATPAELTAKATPTSFITAISGAGVQVNAVSVITVDAKAGVDAQIGAADGGFTLTYSIIE